MEERFKFLGPLLFEVLILTYCFIFRTFLFLQIPTHPENHSIPLNRRISKYIYSGSLRGNGDDTQESWKPLLNTIPAFRGSSEWFAEGKPQHFLYTLCRTNFNKLLHLKSRMMRRE